jgi:hypothetical protein
MPLGSQQNAARIAAECRLDRSRMLLGSQQKATWIAAESCLDRSRMPFGGWILKYVFPSAEGCFDSETLVYADAHWKPAGLIANPCPALMRRVRWFYLPEPGCPPARSGLSFIERSIFRTACRDALHRPSRELGTDLKIPIPIHATQTTKATILQRNNNPISLDFPPKQSTTFGSRRFSIYGLPLVSYELHPSASA